MNLPYVICFITNGANVLMMWRRNPPNQGFWNGVGGKIQEGETPLAAVVREVQEEVGITVAPRFSGLVTWHGAPETGKSGMYAYVAELPPDVAPVELEGKETGEGPLEWLPIRHIADEPDIVSNIPYFLPPMLAGEEPMEHHCSYFSDGSLLTVTPVALPELPKEGIGA